VLRVVYLVFTEGHLATGGETLIRGELCDQAIRLARAELLRQVGRRADAIAAYQAAIALEPPAPERAFLARRMNAVLARGDTVPPGGYPRTLDGPEPPDGRRAS
jgi:predicted RNA polymerase sigma factor